MRYLRTNTATIVTVGPFLDKTDGVTLETGLTITNEKISFTVDANDGSAPTLVLDNVTGATSGTSNDLNYIANCDAGLMQLELAAANVNYLGRAFLVITDAANHCPVFHEFTILPAVIFDAMIAGTDLFDVSMTQILGTAVSAPATAGILDVNLKNIANAAVSATTAQLGVNVVQVSGDATAADNLEAFTDGTGYDGTNNVIPTVTTVGTTTNLTNLPAAAATAAELAKVPKSDGGASWNVTALAAINAEVDTALNTAIPGSPTANSINERVAAIDDLTQASGTGDLAAIKTDVAATHVHAAGAETQATEANAHAHTIDGHITADYGATEKAAIDLLDDAVGGLADIHTDVGTVTTDVAAIHTHINDIHDTDLPAVKADTAAILADTGTDGVIVAAASKSGYALASTGLDAIAVTAPAGVATTFPGMVVQLWRRFFKKATLTATQIKTYADDGSTTVTTQTVSDDSTTQTQGAAT